VPGLLTWSLVLASTPSRARVEKIRLGNSEPTAIRSERASRGRSRVAALSSEQFGNPTGGSGGSLAGNGAVVDWAFELLHHRLRNHVATPESPVFQEILGELDKAYSEAHGW